jgi:hypothetical protein
MVDDQPVGARHGAIQSLQQFISQSPWDWNPVRESLARIIYGRAAPRAWLVSAATIPKRGVHSVGVTKRFVQPEGRLMNCQRGFGILLATAHGALPVDWYLELDDSWLNEPELRERTRVPEDVNRKTHSDHVLEMVDRLSSEWRLPAAPIVSKSYQSHLDAIQLIAGLSDRKLNFLLEVPASLALSVDARALDVQCDVHRSGCDGVHEFTATPRMPLQHHGAPRSRTELHGLPFMSSGIRIPGIRAVPGSPAPALRLFAGWMPADGHGRRFWITNLSDRRLNELLALALLHRQSAADVQEMQESFGLRDFEGRSYPGWHHHMTLVSAAFAFHRLSSGGDRDLSADN